MHPAYFETRFRTEDPASGWPDEFVIISACSPTGEKWPEESNAEADRQLREELAAVGVWLRRVVGYSPISGHAEPSWAAVMPLDRACDLGGRFHQDAIFHVKDGLLSVTHCDARRALVTVGSFAERLDR